MVYALVWLIELCITTFVGLWHSWQYRKQAVCRS